MDQSKKKKQKSIIHFFSPQSGSNSNIGGASETVIKNVEKRFVCQYCEVKVSHLGALKLHEHWCKYEGSGWHTGEIKYYNVKLDKYLLLFEDGV